MTKKTSTKKLLALALSLMLVLALLPVTALAAEDISGATVTLTGGPYTYTGAAIEPTVTVTLNSTDLNSATDYDVTYTPDNINAGTVTVTVTGKGDYEGTATSAPTFEITPANLSTATVTVEPETAEYTGAAIVPTVTVKVGDITLVEGTDYAVTYAPDNTNVGTATVTVTGTGNYTGTPTSKPTFEITAIEAANPTFADAVVYVNSLKADDDAAVTIDELVKAGVLPEDGSITVLGVSFPYTIVWTPDTLDQTKAGVGVSTEFSGTITFDYSGLDSAAQPAWFVEPTAENVTIKVVVRDYPPPPQVIVPEKPDVNEGTPEEELPEEEDTDLEELPNEDDLEEDIVDDVPETGDSSTSVLWAIVAAALATAAALVLLKKKATNN